MPLSSYYVSSPVYIAPPSVRVIPKKISPQDIKSMQTEPITVGYGHAQPTMIHTKDSYATRTSGNRFLISHRDFIENGPLYNNDEYGHGHWKFAGEDNPPYKHNVVTLPPRTSESMAIGSFEERLASFQYGDTPLPKYVTDFEVIGFRINDVGTKVSQLHNLKYHLNSYFKTEDGKELPASLNAEGGKPAYIELIGIGGVPEDAVYGVTRTKDGKIILLAAEDSYDKTVRDARYLDMDVYDLMNSTFVEELAHIWFRDFDKPGDYRKKERRAKEVKKKHYQRLLENAKGDPKKRWVEERRKKQVEAAKLDIATIEERYGHGSFYKQLYENNRAALEEILAYEAVEQKGYRGKDVKDYVAKRLEEIGKEVGEESRMSRLEQIAEKGDKKVAAKEADSKESSEAPSE